MLIRKDTLQPWEGEALNEVKHPIKALETLWSDAELSEIGLVRGTKFVVPQGYRTVGDATYDITGQQTYAVELIPPRTAEQIAKGRADDIDNIMNMNRLLNKVLFRIAKKSDPDLTPALWREWLEGIA